MTRPFDLQGAAAVVTGAGSGIGRATAMAFARRGARVVIGDLREERAIEAVGEITDAGGHAIALGSSSAPRAPNHAISEAPAVGELVADAVTSGRFLVTTAPELNVALIERAADLDAYLQAQIAELETDAGAG